MSWLYSQKTGVIRKDAEVVGCGYAGNNLGAGQCKNNPDAQTVHNHGPLPRGIYEMQEPVEQHPTVGHFAIPLKPNENNQMFGRSAFYIHGDSSAHPGQASEGCIVAALAIRKRMWASDDHQVEVTE